jgi:hypothetical protein
MITTQRIADAHRLEIKKKKRRSISEANIIYHQKHIYIYANPLTKVFGLHATRKFLQSKEEIETTKKPNLRTSAFCSVAEEGVANSAPEVEGGAKSAVARVEKGGTTEAAAAAEGEIIDTMAGTNFFAFSKKDFSSERVRP